MFFILYKVTNLINQKIYVGIHKTNNLEDGYLGSGKVIKQAIKKYGKENFKKEILEFCNSWEELQEKESKYVNKDFIKEKNNYNLKTGGGNGILSDESKRKISDTLKNKYKNGELISSLPTGLPAWNKGLKKETDKRITYTGRKKGSIPWNKGLKGVQKSWNKGKKGDIKSEETKLKTSQTLKERYSKQEHHSKGKEPWNKGKKGLQVSCNKGLKKLKDTECPHCKKILDYTNAKRWHFDNCKFKVL